MIKEPLERKVLTKAEIKRETLKKFGYCTAVHLGYFILIFPFAAFVFYISSLLLHNYISEPLQKVVAVVFCALLVYFIFALGYHALKSLCFITNIITVLTSGFDIVQDTLINSDTQEYNAFKRYAAFSRRSHYSDGYEEVMYFSKYGRTVNCMLDLYSEEYGEKFYLIVYGRKNKIAKAYCANKYDVIE